ncbi:MAG TPA: cation:proton antiporter [Myxococcaceae bacterium]|nr:cation:proton antiporter [Myxococcaceae bacterium]
MESTFAIATLWIGLGLIATLIAARLRVSSSLTEIIVGIVAAAVATRLAGSEALGAKLPWLTFLASTGSVVLTFLAGAELDPAVLRQKWREVSFVGLVGFMAPFLGCAAVARFLLGWSGASSWLAGVALSTTSMAVVYAVMLELGFNKTEFGKGILGACFINDLGTVIALGLLFAPFTLRTVVFLVASAVVFVALPFVTPRLLARFGDKPTEVETKWILFVLFGLGALAFWSGSEAVLPAYIAGMLLAGALGRNHGYIRRLRTLTLGLLAPFYFIRAGSFVSVPALLAAPMVFLALFSGKVFSKIFGLYPVVGAFRRELRERWYYTLLMSTGLTFGTISALYGLTHGIVSQTQYSHLVAVVIGSAIVPTMIANAAFMPRHLLPAESAVEVEDGKSPRTSVLEGAHDAQAGG